MLAGYYSSISAATTCTMSIIGTYAKAGSTSYSPCSAGTYQDQKGAGNCSYCPPGSVSTSNSMATSCGTCSDGTYMSDYLVKSGITTCTNCPAHSQSRYDLKGV